MMKHNSKDCSIVLEGVEETRYSKYGNKYENLGKIIFVILGSMAPVSFMMFVFAMNYNIFLVMFAAIVSTMLCTFAGALKEKYKKIGVMVLGYGVLLILCEVTYIGTMINNTISQIVGFIEVCYGGGSISQGLGRSLMMGQYDEFNTSFGMIVSIIIAPILYLATKEKIHKFTCFIFTIPFTLFAIWAGTAMWYNDYLFVATARWRFGSMTAVMTLAYYMLLISLPGRKKHLRLEVGKSEESHHVFNGNVISNIVFLIVVVIVMQFVVPELEYTRGVRISELKYNINNRIAEIDWGNLAHGIFLSNDKKEFSDAEIEDVELGAVDEVKFTGENKLILDIPFESQTIYLKGFIASDYDGRKWSGMSQSKSEVLNSILKDNDSIPDDLAALPYNLSLYNMSRKYMFTQYQILERTIGVQNLDMNNKIAYIPYFANDELKHNFTKDGIAIIGAGDNSKILYQSCMQYTTYSSNDKIYKNYGESPHISDINISDNELIALNDYLNIEKDYRNFVYDTYLSIPKGLTRFDNEFSNINIEFEGNSYHAERFKNETEKIGIQPYINYVVNYLNTNCTYNTAPGKAPTDQDFVEYFLFDSKEGYCSYYASAAVLMFRKMGIPARYVEGYAVNPYTAGTDLSLIDTRYKIDVRDYYGHAWVEVYQDGFGWIPVDVTPATSVALQGGEAQKYNHEVNETTTMNTSTTAEETTTEAEADTETTTIEENADNKGIDLKGIINVCKYIALAFSVVLVYCLFTQKHHKLEKKLCKSRSEENYNAVVSEYERILRDILEYKKSNIKHYTSKEDMVKILVSENADILSDYTTSYNQDDHILLINENRNKKKMNQILSIIEKGVYSNETITHKEFDEVNCFVSRYSIKVYKGLKPIQKVYYKYVKCLYLKE